MLTKKCVVQGSELRAGKAALLEARGSLGRPVSIPQAELMPVKHSKECMQSRKAAARKV